MGYRRRPQNDQRADLRGKGFASIPTVVLDSEAWRTATVWERSVMLELVKLHNGFNNGQIGASQRVLAHRLNTTNMRQIGRAIAQLMMRGLIDVATECQRSERLAREYRITWLPTGEPPYRKPATDEWRHFRVDDVSAEQGPSADDVSAERPKPADNVSARIAQHRQKTVT